MFVFDTHDVPVETTSWVADRLAHGQGGWVFGPVGTGKSHAVRKAVNGAVMVEVATGPLLSQRFAADVALRLGTDGREVLEAFRAHGLDGALRSADKLMNGRGLVVDGVDELLGVAQNLDDPAGSIWQEERICLLDWLRKRVVCTPTFLVGRMPPRAVPDEVQCRHRPPKEWPIKLRDAPRGFRDWATLGTVAGDNPAVMILARAVVPLIPAEAFNAIVGQARDDEASVSMAIQLGAVFRRNSPPIWQDVLAIVRALDGVPKDALIVALEQRIRLTARGAAEDPIEDMQPVVDRLLNLRLIEERLGVVSLPRVLLEAGAVRPIGQRERDEILPSIAHALLAPINDPRSLVPQHADSVLRAHAIFVQIGDASQAERTAILHAHGLVDLARRTSLNERYAESWRLYDGLLRMMESGCWSTSSGAGQRLLSYVRHYRARDGALAGMLDDATCLTEYRRALDDWKENALWHQRTIEALIRLARRVEAVQAVSDAYEVVEDHPRRDEFLRVRPAGTAVRHLPLLSLELIEPVLDLPEDLYPAVTDGLRSLLRRWHRGVEVSELPFVLGATDAGLLVFHAPIKVEVRRNEKGWTARLDGLPTANSADAPGEAVRGLARELADELKRLVSTPSSSLSAKDVRTKGRLLSVVDALNSDAGLQHVKDRWIVGRVERGKLVPTMRHLGSIAIPEQLLPESEAGLYMARVPTHRDGVPSGPAIELVPAGSSLDAASLLELLSRMSEGTE